MIELPKNCNWCRKIDLNANYFHFQYPPNTDGEIIVTICRDCTPAFKKSNEEKYGWKLSKILKGDS